jgi:hypothetical protein
VTLKLQRSSVGESVTLIISGALTDEYLAELEKVVDAEELEPGVILDLQDLTHVTREGVILLARLEARGARLARCPAYLRHWISGDGD